MRYFSLNIKSVDNPNSAKPGDIISFGENKKGIVVKVLNNTVIADITIMENYNFHKMGYERQVVHHSKYKVLPK